MNQQKLTEAGERLKQKGWTLSLAESCTGGLLGSMLTDISGSSAYFTGGIIAYSNWVKSELLEIPPSVLKREGAVSAQTARLMARGARKIFQSDLSLAVTGIAGPTGGTLQKPVGLVYIAALTPGREEVEKHNFKGNRGRIKQSAASAALRLLIKLL